MIYFVVLDKGPSRTVEADGYVTVATKQGEWYEFRRASVPVERFPANQVLSITELTD